MNLDVSRASSTAVHSVLAGGGELGERMRALDWAQTPLGPVEQWPQSLKTAVRILLTSRHPMFVWWGKDLINLYNDAYSRVVGQKHPHGLAQPAARVWHEIWDQIAPLVSAALIDGEGTFDDALLLIMERYGYLEETYYTFSYSPLPHDEGGIGGIFCATTDETQRIIGQRQLSLLRELAAAAADARTVPEACRLSAQGLERNAHDLPFALLYLIEPDADQPERQRAVLAGSTRMAPGHPAAPASIALDESVHDSVGACWPIADALRTGSTVRLTELDTRFTDLPHGAWDRPPREAVILPITASGRPEPAGVLIAGLNPYRKYDDFYQGFLDLAAGQIAAAMATAQAYEDERQRAEALAELDRAKTVFFSNVSHEFRTPLTLLLGPIEDGLMDSDQPLPPAQRERQEVARRNARRLLRLVNTLLDFSRIEAGRVQARYQPTDLAAFTADLTSTFRSAVERADLRLLVDCAPLPDGQPAYVDREMWEKIVLNLLSNAFKYTFSGQIAVEMRASGSHAQLTVRDTGTGISADELPHIFDRFHRVEGARGRTHEGSGIGLALVRELVQLHGGTITVESEIDRGSAFTVTIPLNAAHLPAEHVVRTGADTLALDVPASLTGAAPFVEEALQWLPDAGLDKRVGADGPVLQSDAPDGLSLTDGWDEAVSDDRLREAAERTPDGATDTRRFRILLADDNRDMRTYVSRLLSQRYDVEEAPDGVAALAAARANPPDLVLSDVMMPRMDGFELTAALRSDPATREIPILLLSARAGEEARIEGLQGGADDYLTKPFSARELLARVDTQVQLARLRSEAISRERAARTQLEWLFEQAPAAIALLEGPEHRYTLANSRYIQVIGGRQPVGMTVREALPELEGQGIHELLRQAYDTGVPYIGTEVPVDLAAGPDGALRTIYFNLVFAPMRTPAGEIDGLFIHAYEVTDQVRARQAAEEAARVRDEFLSIASHELRNPVAGLKGTAQLARRSQQAGRLDAERLDRYLTSIERGAARLATLTEDLLDVTRLQRGELPLRLRPTDLAALVRDAVERQLHASGHTLSLQLDDGIPTVPLDPDRIEQIVANLLDNAAKYSPAGGEIRVTLTRDADALVLCVADQGIGLPLDAAERVFEPFGRAPNAQAANIPGLGLGLYICRQIAEQHGGRLWAESAGEGQGATLCLRLPLGAYATVAGTTGEVANA